MKQVMICEGLNDGILIDMIAKSKFTKEQVRIFDQKNLSIHEKKHAETTLLRSFLPENPYNQRKFLVKLEGGKGVAVKIFCKEMSRLIENTKCILMVDLDTGSPQQKIKSIQKHIEDAHFRTTPLKVNVEKKKEHEHLFHFSCDISMKDSIVGQFQVVFFRNSLEYSCSIEKKDSKDVKGSKIKQFIKKEKIQDFFDPILS